LRARVLRCSSDGRVSAPARRRALAVITALQAAMNP
jgi:hypothetical protein